LLPIELPRALSKLMRITRIKSKVTKKTFCDRMVIGAKKIKIETVDFLGLNLSR
jgi:hypothetical protein